ncbi:hypothetical protein CIT26_01520 [Mesorhizobium temperatum]|uniref:Uncharacterized protein n=1 Tax=Mesorhizobium temperatum TaxID=241416 RepID=A0A271LWS2_9HYPH|nr:hypothetical protein CIT26_01520 [Mesorhizobium temperatum]
MLLIHYNSRHVMEKIITPGEPTVPPQTIVEGSIHAGLDVALGDLREASVVITIDKGTVHRPRCCQELVQRLGSAAPAGIVEALGVAAVLPALRRVDAAKADTLASNLDRVAIDDRSATIHRTRQRLGPVCYRGLKACGALNYELGDCGGKRAHTEEKQSKEWSRQSP